MFRVSETHRIGGERVLEHELYMSSVGFTKDYPTWREAFVDFENKLKIYKEDEAKRKAL